jgi:hypothetical protein
MVELNNSNIDLSAKNCKIVKIFIKNIIIYMS